MNRIVAPPLTRSGNYEPVALFEFLSQCNKSAASPHDVAETLGITQDRAIYALGNGFESYRRRARIAEGIE